MIKLNLDPDKADRHYLKVGKIIKKRAENILRLGVTINHFQVFPIGRLRQFLQELLDDKNLKPIITGTPDDLVAIVQYLKANGDANFFDPNHEANHVLDNLFIISCYNNASFSKYEFIKNIGIDTCPYCNRNYIYRLSESSNIKPQIDHFLPQSIYPIFGMSYYNLIPSCQTCNGLDMKGSKDSISEGLISPYTLSDTAFKFTYELNSINFLNSIIDKNSVTVKFKSKIDSHLRIFYLLGFYQEHADHVIELIIKRNLKYSRKYRKYLKSYRNSGLKFSESEIDRMILGNYANTDEVHKRPLAKLYQDIGRQIGLI